MFGIDLEQFLFRLKIISSISSLVFAGLGVFFFVKFRELVGIKIQKMSDLVNRPKSAGGGAVNSKWEEVLRHLDSANEAEWKFAVIEADKLVDEILRVGGFGGESMGERLMSIDKSQLVSLEGLWEAHKIRNRLVHDVNYFLRYAEAKKAVQLYEKALQELNVI